MSSLAVGIDLGTTNSCIAVYRNGRVEIIESRDERQTIPSFVFYGEDGTVVGEEAQKLSAINPQNGIFDAKRMIGRKFEDPELQKDIKSWPFTVTRGANGEAQIELTQKGSKLKIRPEEVSAQVLRQLRENASLELEEDVVNAVITVPAYFSNQQRMATKDAARIAGLNVLKLVNEPTAAAQAFARAASGSRRRTVFVYDLGGGTFDVSLIAFAEGSAEVKAVGGDTHLGGRDFDNRLMAYFMAEMAKQYGFAVVEQGDQSYRRAIRRLRASCEIVKKKLSQTNEVTLNLDAYHGVDVSIKITQDKFEQLNQELFQKTFKIVDDVLADANIQKSQIDDVILVGGSTRIPKIQEMVKAHFDGKRPNKSVNPDEAVAVGAALEAALLNDSPFQNTDSYTISDVTPLSLGIETIGEIMSIIIQRNTRIPFGAERTYYTSYDNQDVVRIGIYEGEDINVNKNIFLGEFHIEGITPRPRGQVDVLVKFEINLNGILNVTAKESSKNMTKKLNIVLDNGRFTEEEIQERIARSEATRAGD